MILVSKTLLIWPLYYVLKISHWYVINVMTDFLKNEEFFHSNYPNYFASKIEHQQRYN